ncbi:unnamed protein product, partial [Discosporangium mesarthrocarpum]
STSRGEEPAAACCLNSEEGPCTNAAEGIIWFLGQTHVQTSLPRFCNCIIPSRLSRFKSERSEWFIRYFRHDKAWQGRKVAEVNQGLAPFISEAEGAASPAVFFKEFAERTFGLAECVFGWNSARKHVVKPQI